MLVVKKVVNMNKKCFGQYYQQRWRLSYEVTFYDVRDSFTVCSLYCDVSDMYKFLYNYNMGSFKIRDPILILTYFWLFCKNVRGQLNFWSYKL